MDIIVNLGNHKQDIESTFNLVETFKKVNIRLFEDGRYSLKYTNSRAITALLLPFGTAVPNVMQFQFHDM